MREDSIAKIRNVWEFKNMIVDPIKSTISIDIIDQIASLFAAGSYYYFIYNFDNHSMEFVNSGIADILGIESTTFSMDTLFELMHPEDLDKMHEKELKATYFLFNKIPKEDLLHYKVVYLMRLKHKNGTYKTILHQSKALAISGNGRIQKVLCIHTDITYLNVPFDHKISIISQKRPSYYSIDTETTFNLIENRFKNIFSIREKEIIQKISEGKDFNEIAEQLFVSPHTINTHKRNILKKSGCKNTAELITKCIREGII